MKHYLLEVELTLRKSGNKLQAEVLKRYMNTKLNCLGLTVGQARSIQKQGFSFFKKTNQEVDTIWDYIFFHSNDFEVLQQPLIYYQYKKKELTLEEWRFLKNWSLRVDNWEHSDRLSDIYSCLHEKYPKIIYPVMQKWNKSNNPWLRRLSIVSLLYYSVSRAKISPFDKVIDLVDNIINDDFIYVQKSVGWTLRELYNVYPQKTWVYLKSHAIDLAPASWQAATEKLSSQDKQILIKLRRNKK